jgi:serine phosphatase RsbU (regulator of sigma subunit)
VLTRLDRKIQLFEPDAMATAAYAVIEPARRTVTVSMAGHLPPALLSADGRVQLLQAPADLPLGAYAGAPRRSTTVPMPDAMLFYTDGLVERRGRPLDHSISHLLASLSHGMADELCSQATATLHRIPATDDIALIAVCRRH